MKTYFSNTSEHGGIQMTIIGSLSDLAAYYSGTDGNAWMFHTSGHSWVNQGEVEAFKKRVINKQIRGVIHGQWGSQEWQNK